MKTRATLQTALIALYAARDEINRQIQAIQALLMESPKGKKKMDLDLGSGGKFDIGRR